MRIHPVDYEMRVVRRVAVVAAAICAGYVVRWWLG